MVPRQKDEQLLRACVAEVVKSLSERSIWPAKICRNQNNDYAHHAKNREQPKKYNITSWKIEDADRLP